MDPDATLAEAREAIQAWEFGVAADAFVALDEWLSSGGFPPKAWRPQVETTALDFCNPLDPGAGIDAMMAHWSTLTFVWVGTVQGCLSVKVRGPEADVRRWLAEWYADDEDVAMFLGGEQP